MGWTRPTLDEALARYAQLTDELVGLLRDEGEILHAELGARDAAWLGSQEPSITGRDRDADHAAIDFRMELVRKRADIRTVEAELRYLDHVIGAPQCRT